MGIRVSIPEARKALRVGIDPVKLEASLYRDSLQDFVRGFWSVVVPQELVWNWHMETICEELQAVAMRVIRREPREHDLLINVPPGTTKSTITSIMFPAWLWTQMPACKIITTSHTHRLAVRFARKSRDVVTSEKWKKLYGDIRLREDQNMKVFYENSAGGYRISASTDGAITGDHGDVIIIDDPVDPKEAASEKMLETANTYLKETLSTRKTDKEVTVTIQIGQRLHQNDPAAQMLEDSKGEGGTPVRHINLPATTDGENYERIRPRILRKQYVDGLLDPVRLTRKALERERKRLGEYGFAGQFNQHPVPPGGGMFKTDRIRIDTPPSHPSDWQRRRVRYWDKAGTHEGGAHTAGVKMGIDRKGRIWILHVVRGQWDSHTREQTIKQTAQMDTKIVRIGIEQEPGSGGKESAENTIRKTLLGFTCKAVRPTGDKILRADPFSVQVNAENVWMAPGDWNEAYLEELKFFPFSTFKDQVDASSGAFNMLTEHRMKIGAW